MKSDIQNHPADPTANASPVRGYWQLVADKLRQDPALLSIAEQNINRWLAEGHSAPHRLLEWQELMQAARRQAEGFEKLLCVLRSEDPGCERLRDFDPFAGILTREDRRQARELCGYRH